MTMIDQRPFGSNEEREREKALEAKYRDLGSRDIRAAVEIRRPERKPATKAGADRD